MKYTKLGKSELLISSVTLGCMAFSGDTNWGFQDEKDSIDAVRAALDSGITSFDTAEMYGAGMTEEILGKALGSDRSSVVIASKVLHSNLTEDKLINACENSLKRLGTDYIDLYYIHWPNDDIPIDETMSALLKLKEQGKIREIGVSNFGLKDLDKIKKYGCVVANQLAYSLLYRGIEYSIVPKCIENNISIFTYSSLAQGLLSGKYKTADDFPVNRARTKLFSSSKREFAKHGGEGFEEGTFEAIDKIRKISKEIGEEMADVALAWSLAQPGITSVVVGGRNREQVLTNAKGASLNLSDNIIKELTEITENIKKFIGDDADPWAYGRIK